MIIKALLSEEHGLCLGAEKMPFGMTLQTSCCKLYNRFMYFTNSDFVFGLLLQAGCLY